MGHSPWIALFSLPRHTPIAATTANFATVSDGSHTLQALTRAPGRGAKKGPLPRMLTVEDERALVTRARAGDDAAFAALVESSKARVWSICLRITGNHSDAEDALQDALSAAWQHLARFRDDARFSTWLYRIASNASLAVVRRRRDTPSEVDPGWLVMDDPTSGYDDIDRVQRALATVPETFRAALVLREYGALTYEEIAAATGVGVQTVKSRLNRARAAVSAALAGDGGGGS